MTSSNSSILSDGRRALLAQLMAEAGLDTPSAPEIPRRTERDRAPLTYAQEVLWLLERATPPNAAYNTPVARRLRGRLDREALARALQRVVRRHETLRSVFVADADGAVQLVRSAPEHVLRIESVAHLVDEREAAARQLVDDASATPFDLTTDAPFRALLVEVAPDDHVLLLLTHHIASDAWSYSVLLEELSEAYAVECGESSAPSAGDDADRLQFGDFAAWQRDVLRGEALEARLRYWRDALAGHTPLNLPVDFASAAPSSAGACVRAFIPPSLAERLRDLAAANGATLYMVLLSAFQVVLRRWSSQDDIVVGSAVAGRVQRDTERMIGYFSQALPLRTRVEGDPSFATLLARVADTVLGAFEHQDVPVESLALELRRAGAPPEPLFRVVLTMQDALASDFRAPGIDVTSVDADTGATKFDLTILAAEAGGGIELSLWYRTSAFEHSTAARLLAHVEHVLTTVVNDPTIALSSIDLLSRAERAVLAVRERTSVPAGTSGTLVDLVAAAVARDPDSPALDDGVDVLTAREMWDGAGRVANLLTSRDAGSVVGLDLDRSAAAIVALLGIWRAGAAYVPLSADWPAARRIQVLRESGARTALTAADRVSSFPSDIDAVAIDVVGRSEGTDILGSRSPSPSDVAYVLFTSGSTGTPKGVEVSHANLVNYVRGVSRALADVADEHVSDGLDALRGARFAFASSLTADLGNTTLLLALCAGGVMDVFDARATTEPAAFAARMRASEPDVMKLTPNHVAALIGDADANALGALLPRRWLVLGGEALPAPLARRVLAARTCRLLNHYGPTEASIGACAQEVSAPILEWLEAHGVGVVPVGTPLANVRAYVVDAHGNDQPLGVPGELVLAGDGVARGYRGRPDLTAARFVTGLVRRNHGERVYRTGDLVRWREGHGIEFLGRTDDQVKIRGFRVELGEIEAVLTGHPQVERAVVGTAGDPVSEVVAWIVPMLSSASTPVESILLDWMRERLPEYMVPSRVVMVDSIPLLGNGKVDRGALRATLARADAPAAGRAPTGTVETRIAEIWSEVLRRDDISATDNFLQLGGQSLLAIRVLGKLSRAFGVRLPLRTLFESPTIEQLAVALEAAMAEGGNA